MKDKNREDLQLVADVCKNDPKAVSVFIVKATSYVRQSAHYHIIPGGHIHKRELIEDTVQEVLFKLRKDDYRALKMYNGENALSTWLNTITKNHLNSYFRKNKQKCEQYDEKKHGAYGASQSQKEFEFKFNRIFVLARGTLMPVEAACFKLKYLEGLSQKEISKILGIKQGTVGSHIKRATDKIKNVLKAMGITNL